MQRLKVLLFTLRCLSLNSVTCKLLKKLTKQTHYNCFWTDNLQVIYQWTNNLQENANEMQLFLEV